MGKKTPKKEHANPRVLSRTIIREEVPRLTQKEYIHERLKDQINWYGSKSEWNKKWYVRLKKCELAMAATIPVIVSFMDGPLCLKLIIAILGACLVGIGGLHGLQNYHENWIEYRSTSEVLKHELYFYQTKTGPYKDEDDPFPLLVHRTEEIISHENINWNNLCGQSKKEGKSPTMGR
ncbi:DUF4231 domain-containing protein [Dethiosulfovibrio faecalis]|uniref:DUF4231 domain-containing protein n=1 Tax=Dethiosulfovibrio faecalis TaxID=2720018 RepID=UPI001F3D0C12|nr:DUF4231 domain-containing protein [Dethiosulfovibrio faecalis]